MMFDSERAKRVREKAAKGIKPLVSLSVMSYNQEKYIADALDGAFSQTYSPLEIVVSDDCSQDRTWEIIKEKVAAYKGPHKVVLNRNPRNLGITKHVGIISSLCTGDFATVSAGDDIALPNKVQIMVDRWAQDDYRPMMCYTNMYWMEADGTRGGLVYESPCRPQSRTEFLANPAATLPGASAGFSVDVEDIFGPINPVHSPSEDNARAIRGVLLDHLVYIHEPTMCWRRVGLWTGMQGKPEYAKKIYYDILIKAEPVARQAVVDALQLKDYEAIRAMMRWWHECDYRRQVVMQNIFKAPFLFLRAWRNGARFMHLARSTWHGFKYRLKYTWHDAVIPPKVPHAYMGDREIIYRREEKDAT